MAEAVGRAAQLLPASFSMRRRVSSGAVPAPEPPPPPPVSVPALLLSGVEAVLDLNEQSTLFELQRECERAAGVPPTLQRLCVLGAAIGGMPRGCKHLLAGLLSPALT